MATDERSWRTGGQFQVPGGEASVLAWSADDKSLAAGSGAGAVAVFRA
ncbi:MAG: hypothetical protein U0792_24270 [Gemmataceae bacterium]